MESNDSILRDIIPSNAEDNTKNSRRKKCLKICQILLIVFVLGLIAVGIVLLGLILTVSGKSFMRFIIQNSENNLVVRTNITDIPLKNMTSIYNKYNFTTSTMTSTSLPMRQQNQTTNHVFPSTNKRKKLLAKYHDDSIVDELFSD